VNLLWAAVMTVGLVFRDPFAFTLRVLAAALFPVATFFAITRIEAAGVPVLVRTVYVVLLAVTCLLIAGMWRNLWFLYGFGGMVGVSIYAGAVSSFHRVAALVGRDAITAFAWSLGTLLLAFLISAQKARWLPRRMWPRWRNGNGMGLVLKPNAGPTNGLSPDAHS
jgi:hypothetical protein